MPSEERVYTPLCRSTGACEEPHPTVAGFSHCARVGTGSPPLDGRRRERTPVPGTPGRRIGYHSSSNFLGTTTRRCAVLLRGRCIHYVVEVGGITYVAATGLLTRTAHNRDRCRRHGG